MKCAICGNPDSVIHHITYNPPLTIPLCKKHHFMVHFKLYKPQGKTVTVFANNIPITCTDDILLKTEKQYDLHHKPLNTVFIGFKVPKGMYEKLHTYAEQMHTSLTSLVIEAITEYIEKREQK
jgi:hypothetical protein